MRKNKYINNESFAVILTYGIGENALGIIRSLGANNIPIIVVGVKGHLNLASKSKYCDQLIEIDDVSSDSMLQVLDDIADSSNRKNILFIDNCYMINILNEYEDHLKTIYYLTQSFKNLTDKTNQNKIATLSGLSVPSTWTANTWNELEDKIPSNISLIAKPNFINAEKPFKLILSSNYYDMKNKISKHVDSPQNILFQEYIEGEQDDVWVSLGYKSIDSNFFIGMTAVKHTMFPTHGGVMAIGKTILSEKILELSKVFLSKLDYDGIFGLEFKYCKKRREFYYIEMSPRTEGFHNITNLVGIDLPLIAYNDLVRKKTFNGDIVYYDKYWLNIRYLLFTLIQKRTIKEIFRSIKVFFKIRAFQHFSFTDIKPFVFANKYLFKLIIKKMKGLFER
tara:strand:+ start:11368 stop:12549 length:1182 start_codon:yes stop_codon:yes gene_type:complete